MCWDTIALCSEIRTKLITSLVRKRDLTLILVVHRVTTRLYRVTNNFLKRMFISFTIKYKECKLVLLSNGVENALF